MLGGGFAKIGAHLTQLGQLLVPIHQILRYKYGVDDELARLIVARSKMSVLSKGSFLYYQDERADVIAFPLDGILGFHSMSEEGTGVYFNVITPGAILNDQQMILGGAIPTEVKAATDCKILLMSFDDARLLMTKSTSFAQMISHSLATKQRLFNQLFLLRMEKSAPLKVARVLQLLSELIYDGVVPLNIQTLAAMMGISRNTVGREIKRMISQGELHKLPEGFVLPAIETGVA
ncbi:Crp/Fnr family transcriptional regulator [Vibrio sp. WXL210]|uniref:Crp/Fnr family transcriptional regulator n=1 Tax=Vibrio sp. WXL210 TaxID=3450709 RepID=UPI003EC76228